MTLNNKAFQKIIFLLGAGASYDAGCRLSQRMLTSLGDSINNIGALDQNYLNYQNDFKEIYQFILASLHYQSAMKEILPPNTNYLNIEDFVMILRQLIDKEFIIPYPLIGNWNDKITKWELRNGDIFSYFKEFTILQLINNWTRFDQNQANNTLAPIRDL